MVMVNDLAVRFCIVVVGVFLATLFGSFVLKFSCALFNFIAGVSGAPSSPMATRTPVIASLDKSNSELRGDEEVGNEMVVILPGVPMPTFEWAMRILFFATLVNTSGSFIIFRFVRLVGLASGGGALADLSIFLISSPCGILVLGGICAAMLPTNFGKGLLVSLLFHLLVVVFAAVFVGVYVLITLALGLSLPSFG